VIALVVAGLIAADPFEIQVYQAEANPAGKPGLELHLNYVPNSQVFHATLEPSFGITDWWELGGYLQTAYVDGEYRYAGVKLRSKFIAPGLDRGWRVGVNFELSVLPQQFDPGKVGGEIRPIIQWSSDHWLFSVNPIVSFSLGQNGPEFEPAVTVLKRIEGACHLGLEYFGGWGPLARFSSFQNAEHYLYEVVSLTAFKGVELNLGVGEGLTKASSPVVFKMIAGYSWE
jgi:hypothetical protein